jgi:PST family polysaccharide transporter
VTPDPTDPAILSYESPSGPSLRQRASRGFVWMATQTVGSKAISAISQIAVARLLAPSDFGVYSLAVTVTVLTAFTGNMGLHQILVQRRNMRRWSNAAFWLAEALGIFAGLLTAAVAPAAAHFYHNSTLVGLLLVLAVIWPVGSLGIVPEARLAHELRFSAIAKLRWIQGILAAVTLVLLAALHFGPYSFALSRLIVGLASVSVFWTIAPPRIRANPQIRRWKFLISDGGKLMVNELFWLLILQGDYMMLGLFRDATVVGIYYFAFNLSVQTLMVVGENLVSVMFPALSQLQDDPHRQMRAYLNAAKLLATVGIPLCLLQAALADPALRLLVGVKWIPSIHVLEVLSIAMAISMVGNTASSMLKAQGRFRALMTITICGSVSFLTIVGTASYFGYALSVAFGVLIFYSIFAPTQMHIAIQRGGGKFQDIVNVFALPLLFSGIAAAIGYGAGLLVPNLPLRDAFRIVATTVSTVGVYYLLLQLFAKDLYDHVINAIRHR